jgi:septal ring factor EnvC (AmiA/AmiB activator)
VSIVLMILMSSTYSLKITNETLLKRVIGLENAMAAVEKSCTISSDTIASLDQTVSPKIDDLERKIAAVTKQSNLTTAQQQTLRRSLQEIRQSLAHTNARSHFRPNTTGAPLA